MKLRKQMLYACFVVLLFGLVTSGQSYSEAPVLRALVEQGDLPPVEQRLPQTPFVVGPGVLMPEEDLDWEVGQYGGVLRTAHPSPDWNADIFMMANEPLLRAPGVTASNIRPNIVEEFSANAENTEFTFVLRKGLRWSDGQPVTTADVRFAIEDVLLNPELTPALGPIWRSGGKQSGEPLQLTVVDDYAFRISFAEPYGAFITNLTVTGWAGYSDLIKPRHYLEQFHIDYRPLEELLPYLAAEELDDDEWFRLFGIKDIARWRLTHRAAVGFPVLYPWVAVEAPSGVLAFERNPYYFKVDTAGNQLPYIDRLESYEVTDMEMANLKILAGEVDYARTLTSPFKLPVYRENEERGGYRTVVGPVGHVDNTLLFINYTYDDPEWRRVTQDRRFRQAVALAIDKQEIIDSVYLGFATLPTITPAEFAPEEANRLLDEVGLDQRDSEGFRLGAHGETFEFHLEVANRAPDFIPVAELVTAHLQEVGIKAIMRQISPQLESQRATANELQATIGWLHSPIWPSWDDFLPGPFGWGRLWRDWYNTDGTTGEEPPAWVNEVFTIYENIQQARPDTPDYEYWMGRLFAWYYEEIPVVFTGQNHGHPIIAADNLANIIHGGIGIAGDRAGEQFFFRQD